jgi:hypothetical protein
VGDVLVKRELVLSLYELLSICLQAGGAGG